MQKDPFIGTLHAPLSADEALRLLEYPEVENTAARTSAFTVSVAASKAEAVRAGDQAEAKRFWIVEAIVKAHRTFENSHRLLRAHSFYDAWCELEQCEIIIASLARHFLEQPSDPHRTGYIRTMVPRWQSLFPYKFFGSPEFLKKRVECSTCGAKVSLRNHCGHEKGQIYDGEQCYHRVIKADFLSLSLVEKPVQKYSVLFLSTEDGLGTVDQYNYDLVRFAADRLESPYHGWDWEEQTRTIPASAVSHLANGAHCPCGSGNEFGECCAAKPELVVPHVQFAFEVPPGHDLTIYQLNI